MDTFDKSKIRNAAIFLLIAGLMLFISSIWASVDMSGWTTKDIKFVAKMQNILRMGTGFFMLISALQFMIAVKK